MELEQPRRAREGTLGEEHQRVSLLGALDDAPRVALPAIDEWGAALRFLRRENVPVELGPVTRLGVRGEGTSVYFRDPDGILGQISGMDYRGQRKTP